MGEEVVQTITDILRERSNSFISNVGVIGHNGSAIVSRREGEFQPPQLDECGKDLIFEPVRSTAILEVYSASISQHSLIEFNNPMCPTVW